MMCLMIVAVLAVCHCTAAGLDIVVGVDTAALQHCDCTQTEL